MNIGFSWVATNCELFHFIHILNNLYSQVPQFMLHVHNLSHRKVYRLMQTYQKDIVNGDNFAIFLFQMMSI